LRAQPTPEEEAAAEVMAVVAAEVMAAAVVDTSAAAAVHISAVAGTSEAVDISAAALALAECVSAVHISVARAAAAGPGYRGLRRDQVSAANARLRSTAIGRPAAQQR